MHLGVDIYTQYYSAETRIVGAIVSSSYGRSRGRCNGILRLDSTAHSLSIRGRTNMPQKLEGSCHCGAVRFTCDAFAPVPYRVREVSLAICRIVEAIRITITSCVPAPFVAKSVVIMGLSNSERTIIP